VHAFDAWPFAIYGYVAVLGTRKKLFITGVATYSVIPKERFLKALALKIAYWRSSAVLCVSSYTCKRIQERVKINGRVVFWGASELPLPDAAETSRIRSRYHLENKTPILLTVGQIKHRKGQLDTLKAVALLKKRHPHILYIMVGSDAETGYVKSIRSYAEEYDMVGNYLIVPDVRSDLELAGIYKNADVFLLNSNNEGDHFEGFGLVMLEAAQFGVPSVGSCDCGVQEALIEGHNGYLSRQGDPKNIAQAVEKILTSDRRELAEYAEEFYSRFTWRKTVDAYLEAYETC
jgi:phosphatidylinositol alpha-1,6-mannosyltransferase